MQEGIKLRELLPHIGPFPVVIPVSYFWIVLVFLQRMIFSRVLRGSFVEERKCKNMSGVREFC